MPGNASSNCRDRCPASPDHTRGAPGRRHHPLSVLPAAGAAPRHSTIQPILVDTLPQLQRTQVCWPHFLNLKKKKKKKERKKCGTSLEVHLRICAPNFGDGGSIPGRGTKIPHAAWRGLKKKKKLIGMSHVLMRMVCETVDLKYLEKIQAAESEINSSP